MHGINERLYESLGIPKEFNRNSEEFHMALVGIIGNLLRTLENSGQLPRTRKNYREFYKELQGIVGDSWVQLVFVEGPGCS